VALAGGCGRSDSDGGASATLPSCAEETRRVDPPADLPDELPLPDGLVLTDAQHAGGKEFRLRGVVGGDLDGVAGFFQKELPANGFALEGGDAEEHEQEGEFAGNGYEGTWRVVANPTDCPVVAVFVTLDGGR